jgi:urease accessory protein
LPLGAYAYSHGLEAAVQQGWIDDEASAGDWIAGVMKTSLGAVDVPILTRLYSAWQQTDQTQILYWNQRLGAFRESGELSAEDRHFGRALARLVRDLGVIAATPWANRGDTAFATIFALSAVAWHIPLRDMAQGYLWAWAENQVTAGMRLVPLGQTGAQRILVRLMDIIPVVVESSMQLAEEEIGQCTPGLAIASAHHELQYSRLFRS